MDCLHVSEYQTYAQDGRGGVTSEPMMPPVADYLVQIGPKSVAAGAPFDPKTLFIEIVADARCAIAIGTDPTADPTLHVIGASERLRYGVKPGHRIAVIAV